MEGSTREPDSIEDSRELFSHVECWESSDDDTGVRCNANYGTTDDPRTGEESLLNVPLGLEGIPDRKKEDIGELEDHIEEILSGSYAEISTGEIEVDGDLITATNRGMTMLDAGCKTDDGKFKCSANFSGSSSPPGVVTPKFQIVNTVKGNTSSRGQLLSNDERYKRLFDHPEGTSARYVYSVDIDHVEDEDSLRVDF